MFRKVFVTPSVTPMRTIRTITIAVLTVGLLAGSAAGVAAQDDETAAVVTSFTGVFRPGGEELPVERMDVTLPNGFSEAKPGFASQTSWESTDPRLSGDHIVIANWVIDPNGFDPWSRGDQVNLLGSNIHQLTNDEGSWLGEGTSIHSTDLDIATEIVTFVGRDGYEGMTAYALIDITRNPATFSGVVFPTDMPEVPEPYVAQ